MTSIEDIIQPKTAEHNDHATAYEKRMKRETAILSLAVLVTNIVYSILFPYVFRSLIVICSTIKDSCRRQNIHCDENKFSCHHFFACR